MENSAFTGEQNRCRWSGMSTSCPIFHQRQLKGASAVGFGETASAGDGIEAVRLRCLLDDETALAHELYGGAPGFS